MDAITTKAECPQCGHSWKFDVGNLISKQLEDGYEKKYLSRLLEVKKEFESKFEQAKKMQTAAENLSTQYKEKIHKEVTEKLSKERKALESQIRKEFEITQAEEIREFYKLKSEFSALQIQNATLNEKLQADFREQLATEVKDAKQKIKEDVEKNLGFQLNEKDLIISRLQSEIKNVQKIEIGNQSQELKGEAAELMLEKWICENYPKDDIVTFKKGERGADIALTVRTETNESAGCILMEIKRTKTWSRDWLAKFREDLRQRKDTFTFGILVSDTYPKGINKLTSFGEIWVCSFTEYQNLLAVLRFSIISLHEMQSSMMDRDGKVARLHSFFTGQKFRQNVELMIESYTLMRTQLDKEKTVIQGYWTTRQTILDRTLTGASELYHSIRLIIGSNVPEIKALTETDAETK